MEEQLAVYSRSCNPLVIELLSLLPGMLWRGQFGAGTTVATTGNDAADNRGAGIAGVDSLGDIGDDDDDDDNDDNDHDDSDHTSYQWRCWTPSRSVSPSARSRRLNKCKTVKQSTSLNDLPESAKRGESSEWATGSTSWRYRRRL
ncbi:hypothetical protein AN958_02253 [Leucoagaricus sp. SymC.cos]|nr:hypothetical protein AN958_02253 [Leucoagaricus sp. SymC.cos]